MNETPQQRLAEYLTAKINATTTTSISDIHNRIYYTNKYLISVCVGLNLIEGNNIFEETIQDSDTTTTSLWDNRKPEHCIKCVMNCGIIIALIISIEFSLESECKIDTMLHNYWKGDKA